MNDWPTTAKKLPSITLRDFRGIDKRDAFSIKDVFSPDTVNRTINDNGEYVTRPGYTVLGAAIGTKCLGLGVWKDTELHAVFNDGTWRKWTGAVWTSLASGLSTTATWTFTNFAGNLGSICLIGTNGVDTARYYNGATLAVLGGVPAGANYIAQYADRLWAAVGNELHASSYRMANDWTTVNGDDADSWYTVVETPDGETINGIIPGMAKLIITKPSSDYKLMGYAPSDYLMQPVTYTIGMFNNKSGVILEGWLYQLYSTGFYRYAGGTDPESDFSERVHDYFTRTNATGKPLSAIGTDGVKIYASLAINGTVPDTLIVYDPKKDTFFVWTGYSALHFAQLGTNLYIGDATGRVSLLGGTTDNGTAINWYWTSKPFSGQSMAQGVRFTRMWATVDLTMGSTMDVSLSKSVSSADWESVGSLTASVDIQRKSIYVESSKVVNAKQLRFKIAGSGPCTFHEVAWEQIETAVR